jgi:hypothetical protein
MAVRRSVFHQLGLFDTVLGPGAKYPAGEEYDLTIRVLAAGMKVVNAAEVCVLHLGVREHEAASALVRGYGVAIGAVLAKHVRLGTKGGARLLGNWLAHSGGRAILNAMTGRRPTNLGFVGSLARSPRQPIDASRHVYKWRSNGRQGGQDARPPPWPSGGWGIDFASGGSRRYSLKNRNTLCAMDIAGTARSAPTVWKKYSPTTNAKMTSTGCNFAESPIIFGLSTFASS